MTLPQLKRFRTSEKIEFLDLNDDCLMFIFRYLPLRDLNSIGLLNHRFHHIANSTYKYHRTFKHLDVTKMAERYASGTNRDGIDHHSIENIKGYLQRFGNLLEQVDFDNEIIHAPCNLVNEIFSFIVIFCSDSFKLLKMYNVQMNLELVPNIQGIFSRLTKLDINCGSNWTQILPMCTNLDTLLLKCTPEEYPLNLNYEFPKLKIFQFEYYWFPFHRHNDVIRPEKLHSLLHFIEFHSKLVELSLTFPYIPVLDLDVIGRLTDLKEFTLIIKHPVLRVPKHDPPFLNFDALRNLTNLKKVEIYHVKGFVNFLQNSESVETLEHLAICVTSIDEPFINGLSRFRNLRHLSIETYCFNEDVHPISDLIFQQLRNINSITTLSLTNITDRSLFTRFMHFLILNNLTLTELTLKSCYFDAQTILDLSELQNLQRLCWHYFQFPSTAWNTGWQKLKRLNQIKYLEVYLSPAHQCSILSNFFNYLGCRDTLQHLNCLIDLAKDEIFQSIRNFQNLEKIELFYSKDLQYSHPQMIGSLRHLKELSIYKYRSTENRLRLSIIEFVKRYPTLEVFTWTESYNESHNPFDVKLYDQLVDIVKNRSDNRKLIVKSHPFFSEIPHYSNDKQFVEIRIDRDLLEHGVLYNFWEEKGYFSGGMFHPT